MPDCFDFFSKDLMVLTCRSIKPFHWGRLGEVVM